jgi:hypothetical protein
MLDKPPNALQPQARPGATAGCWLLVALALGLAGPTAQAAVTVTRLLPACSVVAGVVFQADLVVEVTDSAPAALIVAEEPPAGWAVTTAAWIHGGRAEPFNPVVTHGTCHWLFDPLGIPVGSGILRLTIAASPPEPGAYRFAGSAKWLTAHAEDADTVDHQCELDVTALHQGWNALSLPFQVEDRDALGRLFRNGNGQPLLLAPVYVWDTAGAIWSPLDAALAPGQGFLGGVSAGGRLTMLVSATPPLEIELRPGWNLVGVCRALRVQELREHAPALGPVWRWDAELRAYRLLPPEGELLPGAAYSTYHAGPDTLVIPLGQTR